MRKEILCSNLLLVLTLIDKASPESGRCERRLVCGSDGQVYETSCDFQRALRLNRGLGTLPLHECFGMVYVPDKYFWAPGNSKSALMSARRNYHASTHAEFVDGVKSVIKKADEGIDAEHAVKAVHAVMEEIDVRVKDLVQDVKNAMTEVLDDVKKAPIKKVIVKR